MKNEYCVSNKHRLLKTFLFPNANEKLRSFQVTKAKEKILLLNPAYLFSFRCEIEMSMDASDVFVCLDVCHIDEHEQSIKFTIKDKLRHLNAMYSNIINVSGKDNQFDL